MDVRCFLCKKAGHELANSDFPPPADQDVGPHTIQESEAETQVGDLGVGVGQVNVADAILAESVPGTARPGEDIADTIPAEAVPAEPAPVEPVRVETVPVEPADADSTGTPSDVGSSAW